jgi:hypothetical protein
MMPYLRQLAEFIFVMEGSYHWSMEAPLGELAEEWYRDHFAIGKSIRETYPY